MVASTGLTVDDLRAIINGEESLEDTLIVPHLAVFVKGFLKLFFDQSWRLMLVQTLVPCPLDTLIVSHSGQFVNPFLEVFQTFFECELVDGMGFEPKASFSPSAMDGSAILPSATTLALLTLSIIALYKRFVYWQNVQRIKSFRDFFVQFAERPCERKNTVML